MKSVVSAGILATLAASVVASPVEKRYTGPNGKTQNTSAGGTGPNPKGKYPGDGGNGLTVTVIDPAGNNSIKNPTYRALTDFDYDSFNLALHQEYIELDLFNYGLVRFSEQDFEDAGMNPDYRSLLKFFANQETGHAQLITNIVGEGAAKQCTYNYSGAFDDIRSYFEFNVDLTRWGESGVYGFLSKLNSKPSAQLLVQSISTEARQQMAFRQFTGIQAVDVFFEAGIPQAWSWTLLAPWIQSCPAENPRLGWSNYATLKIDNNPSLAYAGSKAAVSTNRTALLQAGDKIEFSWTPAGEKLGPNNSYTTVSPGGDKPTHALFVAQLNATYAPFHSTGPNSGYAYIPSGNVYDTELSNSGPALNGSNFAALVSGNPYLTPYNLTEILPHMIAGPAIAHFG